VVPKDGYDMVRDPALLNQINWGKYILDEIYSGAKQVQAAIEKGRNRFNVYGCLLFLQVKNCIILYFKILKFHNLTRFYLYLLKQILYFESVETGFIRVEPTAYPRIAFYTGGALIILIDEDTEIVGNQKIYGIMPVRFLTNRIIF
jgi:hypothetical protein